MKRGKITKKWYFWLILIIVFSGLIAGVVYLKPFSQSFFAGGMTITSISSTKVISNDADISQAKFIVTAVLNGGSESVVGTITPSQFKSEAGYETVFPLEIKATAYDETADYRIINDIIPVYSWELQIMNRPSFFSSAPQCPATDGFYHSYGGSLTGLTGPVNRYCLYRKQIGVKGHLENPSIKGKSTISLTSNGVTVTKEITSDTRTVEFMDGSTLRATATLTGSLITGDPAPSESPYVTLNIGGNWILSKLDYYSGAGGYSSSYDTTKNAVDKCLGSIIIMEDSAKTCFTNAVNLDDRAISKLLTNTQIYGTQQITKDISGNDIVRISLDRRISNPEIRFLVNADWLGIKIGVSKPSISDSSCDTYDSGDDGYAHLTIKNDGTAEGTIAYTLEGCGFNPQYGSFTNQVQLGPGESQKVDILINSGSVSELKDTCKLTAYDVSKPSNVVTSSVSCEVKAPKTCNPGEQTVQGFCVLVCKADGKGFDDSKAFCCDSTPLFGNSTYTCEKVLPPKPITDCSGFKFFSNIEQCVSQASLFDKIKLGVTLLGFILSMIFTGLGLKKLNILQKNNIASKLLKVLTVISIGIIMAFLLFLLFWYGVIALIIVGIIYYIIPAKRFIRKVRK